MLFAIAASKEWPLEVIDVKPTFLQRDELRTRCLNMIRSGHRRLARSFNLCYRYIDDLIVFNNKKFLDYLKEIYPSQLIVEKANKSDHLADYLDIHHR